jgi:hypothetical protein
MLSRRTATVVLCLFAAFLASGQETLLQLDHLWRYEQSGTDLGTTWRSTAYDDSAWPAGRGVLALEDNEIVRPLTNTVLSRVGTNGEYKIIDYFRTHFTVPEVRPGYFLSAAVLVDDGAVAYLNGAELFRIRMPQGPIGAMTLATETIDVGREGVFATTNVASVALRAGENVLAVEVHQPYVTSSDVTLGMVLTYAPMEPVSIVAEPVDQTIEEGKVATLAVRVRGTLPHLQWWKNGQALVGLTNGTLSLPDISRANAGQYYVTISNDVSAISSRVATLTVVLDRESPQLVSASASGDNVYALFSEPLEEASATDPANFRLVNANGEILPILDTFYYSHTTILSVTGIRAGLNHYLYVSNVRDRFGNVIAPNSGVNFVTAFTNIPLASVWRFNDLGVSPDADWNQLTYNDSQWPSGTALLYNDSNLSLQPPAVRNTVLQVTNASGPLVTHYFRLHFTNVISRADSSLEFSFYVDDGAVFYLNGREVNRFNMPSGTIGNSTRASSSSTEGVFNGGFALSGTNLVAGHNVLAVEVHQFSLMSPTYPDVSFALQCRANANSLLNAPVQVLQPPEDRTVREGATVSFSAVIAGAETFQWLRGGTPVPGATSPLYNHGVAHPNDSGATFSLVASNSFGAVTTRTARLTVIADITPPRLLSANMGTNVDRVVLAFSEPLDPLSLASGNFSITNWLGGTLDILSAEIMAGTNIALTTAPRLAGARYAITVRNIIDSSLVANALNEARLGVGYEEVLVNYDSLWRYDDSGTNFSTDWRQPWFDDAAWPIGPGLLGFEDSPLLPVPIRTTLPPPEFRGPTYFFRHAFQFSGDPANTVLQLRHIVDDGVVLFLNGQEVHRARVPVGQNAGTVADSAINDGTVEGPFVIPFTALASGENILAAEVHQVTITSADSVFGLELSRAFRPEPPGPSSPSLSWEWRGGQLLISWDASDFLLESASSLTDPWTLVSQPTIPYSVARDNSARFFRLKKDL